MAHLDGRDELEKAFAFTWGSELRRQFRGIMGRVREDLSFDDPTFWGVAEARATAANEPALEAIYVASANQVGIGEGFVDFAIVNDRGAAWAADYSFELVRGINNTTLTKLRKEIPKAIQEGLSIGDIRKKLAPTFGPGRAELIGITETTRAAVEGERGFIKELNTLGIQTEAFWLTARDDKVDKLICAPLDGVKREQGIYSHPGGRSFTGAPAHPGCRCGEQHRLVEEQ